MRQSRLTTLAIVIAAVSATPAGAELLRAKCVLEIDGETYIEGPCPVVMEDDGSFTLGADGKSQVSGYFAMVIVNGPDTASAYWNEAPGSSHAQGELGEVHRDGACWSNARARLCAWH